MKITRQNPTGGRKLDEGNYPLHQDSQGNFGFLLGYIDKDTILGDKIIIPMTQAKDFAEKMGFSLADFNERFKSYGPKKSLRQRLIEWLGGRVVVDN